MYNMLYAVLVNKEHSCCSQSHRISKYTKQPRSRNSVSVSLKHILFQQMSFLHRSNIYILNRIRTEAYAYLVLLLKMNAIVEIMAIKLYVNVVETNLHI